MFFRFLFLSIFCLGVASANPDTEHIQSPWHASLQFVGISYHPGGGNYADDYPLKIDDDAYWLLNIGGALNVDYDIVDSIAFIRGAAAFYKDCAFFYAGYFHLGIRGVIVRFGKHSINGGMGATLIYRENWNQIPEYENDSFYENAIMNGRWEYQFIFYGGEFDYIYQYSKNIGIQYSIVPGFPMVITSKLGVRYSF
ncbi:MAG: hypothetical protein OCD76_20495 [Reichenbachiella sp.]